MRNSPQRSPVWVLSGQSSLCGRRGPSPMSGWWFYCCGWLMHIDKSGLVSVLAVGTNVGSHWLTHVVNYKDLSSARFLAQNHHRPLHWNVLFSILSAHACSSRKSSSLHYLECPLLDMLCNVCAYVVNIKKYYLRMEIKYNSNITKR